MTERKRKLLPQPFGELDRGGKKRFKAQDYIKPDNSYAFGGQQLVELDHPQDSRKHIERELSKSENYTIHKKHRKPTRYPPVFVDRKRQLIEADTAVLKKDRNGYKYILCFIDDFTKFTWVYPLKQIGTKISIECLENVIQTSGGQVPSKLYTDRGTEFTGHAMRDYCTTLGIEHILSYSQQKCPVVERFIGSLKNILMPMEYALKQPWSSLLDMAHNIYLKRRHRSIGMSPRRAELADSQYHLWWNAQNRFKEAAMNWQRPKYKIGHRVRVYEKKLGRGNAFKRGFTPNYSPEIFRIRKVLSSLPRARYLLDAGPETGYKLKGRSFFQDELVRVRPPTNENKKKKKGGGETIVT